MALTKYWFSTATSTSTDRQAGVLSPSMPAWNHDYGSDGQSLQSNATIKFYSATNTLLHTATVNTPQFANDTRGVLDVSFSTPALQFKYVVVTIGSWSAKFTASSTISLLASSSHKIICGYDNALLYEYDYDDYFPWCGFMWHTNVQPNVANTGNLLLDVGAVEHVITYYPGTGATVDPSQSTVSAGSSVSTPVPTKTGYDCTGWWTAASGGVKRCNAGSSYTPSQTESLYAQWTPKTFSATWDAQGGSPATAQTTQTYDQNMVLPAQPTKFYYDFAGWWTAPDGGGTQVSSSTVFNGLSNVTLYAKWTPKYPTGNISIAGSYTAAEFNERVNAPYVTGVTLTGDVSVSGSAEINNFVNFTGDYTLDAYGWTLRKYRVIDIGALQSQHVLTAGDPYTPSIHIPDNADFSLLLPKPTIQNTEIRGCFSFGNRWKHAFDNEWASGSKPKTEHMIFDNVDFYGPISGHIEYCQITDFTHTYLPIKKDGTVTTGFYNSAMAFYVSGKNNTIRGRNMVGETPVEKSNIDYRTCRRDGNGTIILGAVTDDGHETAHGGLKITIGRWGGSCSDNVIENIYGYYAAHEEAMGSEYYDQTPLIGEVISKDATHLEVQVVIGSLAQSGSSQIDKYIALCNGSAFGNFYRVASVASESYHGDPADDDYALRFNAVIESVYSTTNIAIGDRVRVSGANVNNTFRDITVHNKWGTPSWGQGCNVGLSLFFGSYGNIIENFTAINDKTISEESTVIGGGSHYTSSAAGTIIQMSYKNQFNGIHAYGQKHIAYNQTVWGDDLVWMTDGSGNYLNNPAFDPSGMFFAGGDTIANITADNDAKFVMINMKNITINGVPETLIDTTFDPGTYNLSYAEMPADRGQWAIWGPELWNSYAVGMNPYYPTRQKAASLELEPDWLWLYWAPGGQESFTTFAAINYLVTLDAMGGVSPGIVSFLDGEPRTLPLPTRSRYRFLGWNTMPDGSGTSYDAENTYYSIEANITLYAQWEPAGFPIWVGDRQVMEIYVGDRQVIAIDTV